MRVTVNRLINDHIMIRRQEFDWWVNNVDGLLWTTRLLLMDITVLYENTYGNPEVFRQDPSKLSEFNRFLNDLSSTVLRLSAFSPEHIGSEEIRVIDSLKTMLRTGNYNVYDDLYIKLRGETDTIVKKAIEYARQILDSHTR